MIAKYYLDNIYPSVNNIKNNVFVTGIANDGNNVGRISSNMASNTFPSQYINTIDKQSDTNNKISNEKCIDNNEGVVKDNNISHQQCSKKYGHKFANTNYYLNTGVDNHVSMVAVI